MAEFPDGDVARLAEILARDGAYVTLRSRRGEMRKVLADCRATIGEIGNAEHMLRQYGKAGAMRWRGVRPTVRGVVMNPVDHPHGGGEGKTSGGRHPVTPWGVPTKGYKTRSNQRNHKCIDRRRAKYFNVRQCHATFSQERSIYRPSLVEEGRESVGKR